MSDDATLEAERALVCELGRELLERELTTGTGGNLSARVGERIAASPSGVPYDEIEPESVPVIDLDGVRIAGDLEPTSEAPMHAAVYRRRGDVGGIVHTHSPYASTFAVLAESIPPTHYLVAYAGREVPAAGYAPPGTEELGEMAVEALGTDYDACLLAHHGVVAVGETLGDAFETALVVEHVARVHYQARSVGEPERLPVDEVDRLREIFREYRR